MKVKQEICLFWFRRDLRLDDNTALIRACSSGLPVLPVFIFDTNILDKLDKPSDLRVQFIHQTLEKINQSLRSFGSAIHFSYSTPTVAFSALLENYEIKAVFTNHDHDPYAIQRDQEIHDFFKAHGIGFHTSKDHVIFEKLEVCKDDGNPYTVFTPYSRKWKVKYNEVSPLPNFFKFKAELFFQWEGNNLPELEVMGFEQQQWDYPAPEAPLDIIRLYSQNRDFPALHGTSRLGVHLRFGTISIRDLAITASQNNETFLNELIWRDFYHMILANFPSVGKSLSFKKDYDAIEWRNNESDFEKWCKGNTGYPIVDAGMRELNQTGFMHNRVRMITASFLTKHLLIDWRWGESWFAAKLLDYDLAANNGGWQWAAGSGCDAAPYFRVFNPTLQAEKFDKKGEYIRKWVPELDSLEYPQPMVVHEFARKRCLDTYARFLKRD
ncbi:MAG: cryptochrome/photolyase family protein [Chitinophagia bacterium]|jgi:deoxyribodipyrimidine photo-lyase